MTRATLKVFLLTGLAAAGWLGPGESGPVATAQAVVGAPATPVSYAGVARRSTVGVGAPGVGVAPGDPGAVLGRALPGSRALRPRAPERHRPGGARWGALIKADDETADVGIATWRWQLGESP